MPKIQHRLLLHEPLHLPARAVRKIGKKAAHSDPHPQPQPKSSRAQGSGHLYAASVGDHHRQ